MFWKLTKWHPLLTCLWNDPRTQVQIRCTQVNSNFEPLLSNAMASVFGLFVVVRVEVDVVQNDDVCSTQVDAKTTGLCRQQEDEDRRVGVVLINHLLSANTFRSALHNISSSCERNTVSWCWSTREGEQQHVEPFQLQQIMHFTNAFTVTSGYTTSFARLLWTLFNNSGRF